MPMLKSASESLKDSGRKDPVKTMVLCLSSSSLVLAGVQTNEMLTWQGETCEVGSSLYDSVCPVSDDDSVNLTTPDDVPNLSPVLFRHILTVHGKCLNYPSDKISRLMRGHSGITVNLNLSFSFSLPEFKCWSWLNPRDDFPCC